MRELALLAARVTGADDHLRSAPAVHRTATESLTGRIFQGDPIHSEAFLAGAARLASVAGPAAGWAAEWRGIVSALRRHRDPDVAELALRLDMESKWQQ